MTTTMKISIEFLEPFRMTKWQESTRRNKNNKEFVRGQAFARWHRNKKDNTKGRPYITGTLLRSAVIRSAENLLTLSDGKISEKTCCPGKFDTEDKDRLLQLRQRSTLRWTDKNPCPDNAETYCPFCELLGRSGNDGKKAEKKDWRFRIHFGNLSLPGKPDFDGPKAIGSQRVLNRVDFKSGKAHDFFKAYEVDHTRFPRFEGEITIDNKVSAEARKLLCDSLKFTDRLCGALCVIRFDEYTPAADSGKQTENVQAEPNANLAEKTAEQIISILDDNKKTEYTRLLADAIRSLRRSSKLVAGLPKDHDGKDDHYLWDIGKKKKDENSVTIRQILTTSADTKELKNAGKWREFCEKLGEALYLKSKDMSGGLKITRRILGDAEFHGKPDRLEKSRSVSIGSVLKETVVCGELVAKTPFFFGAIDEDAKQTALQVLLTPDNKYRLPRSAVRGILRRDLQTYFDSPCNAELGGRPCMCKTCRIMRGITVMDARSEYNAPPEIRHRTRINPFTGTVAEGALFNMEVAPEGIVFPFQLRYRGSEDGLPDALKTVLKWWAEGQAFMSGAASTGKGRFRMENAKYETLDLSDENQRNDYLKNWGWRDEKGLEELKKRLNSGLPEPGNYRDPKWHEINVSIEMASPFINGDPIRAAVDKRGTAVVTFVKYKAEGEEAKPVCAYKAESFRGVIRSAVARIHMEDGVPLTELTHSDCECLLCQIFGSEYEAGKIRFEDLVFESDPEPVTFDHVAIDRFTGGAAAKKKFDDSPLPGSPARPLMLKGSFWIRRDVLEDEEYCKALGKALADVNNGLYPLGGKSAIGYGQVKSLGIKGDDKRISRLMNPAFDETDVAVPEKPKTDAEVRIEAEKVYYPHYFVEPHKKVEREEKPCGHQKFHEGRLTGKIRCKLITKTPLIVPDTSNDDFFRPADKEARKEKDEYHKSYAFFRLHKQIMIPGSELRGMVSSVYETVTNSCFRIFDETKRLSWRMDADHQNVLQDFLPGRVTADGKHIQKFSETARVPFYDKTQKHFDILDEQEIAGEKPVRMWVKRFIKRLSLVDPAKHPQKKQDNKWKRRKEGIATFIEQKNGSYYFNVVTNNGCTSFHLWHKPDNFDQEKLEGIQNGEKLDCWVRDSRYQKAFQEIPENDPDGWECKEGYLHVVGPSKVEFSDKKGDVINNFQGTLPSVPNDWKTIRTNDFKNRKRKNEPVFCCEDDKGNYYTMAKYCETFFFDLKENEEYEIPEKARIKYKELLRVYNNNPQAVPESVFQSRVARENVEKLKSGDLVYFKHNEKYVEDIVPVRISRTVDDRMIGKRMSADLRPCHGDWVEDGDLSALNAYPEKRLLLRHPKGLCPACRLFGTGSYKGRVRFGFASLENDPEWLIPGKNPGDPFHGGPVMLSLLERPRPTWSIPGSDNKFKVPGRKFYVHHHAWKTIKDGNHPTTGKAIEQSPNNRTVEALAGGNSFSFEIAFENLKEWELGLLIHSLQLEKGLAHKLGMAKSMGFGSVEIDVESVRLRKDWKQWRNGNSEIPNWLGKGFAKLKEWFRDELDFIENLKKLLWFPEGDQAPRVCYPMLRKKDDPNGNSGYEELKDGEFKKEDRQKKLTTPWTPWASSGLVPRGSHHHHHHH
uniref:CRISPR-associated RAMP family protein n=1 Tax=Desulfonema ishimotonii TaxID=45657 RepID=UPI002038EC89|nr:Chain A, CRISPR-associated RAMP family protein [Desulfonema ishimotonii]7Y9X_A Chain A, CRISPR-associated RAMP family protein [Desulfonema ishimotonii]